MKVSIPFDELNETSVLSLLRSGAKIVGLTYENQSFNLTFEGDETLIRELWVSLSRDVGVEISDSFEEFIKIWGV